MKSFTQNKGYNFNGFVKNNTIRVEYGCVSVGISIYYNVNMEVNCVVCWDTDNYDGIYYDTYLDYRLMYYI